MNIKDIYDIIIEQDASDAFIRAGSPLKARVYTQIKTVRDAVFSVKDVDRLISEITDEGYRGMLDENKSCEFATWHGERWRFRVAIFYQRNTRVIIIRKIDLSTLSFEKLNLPAEILSAFCRERRGLILLSGMAGSGKSTTIAAMIEHINQNFGKHILTIEEPIEFIFKDKKSIINQREIGKDVVCYESALREANFHSPDLIYVGNIRDWKTCHAALTAAEAGALVLSTVHAINTSSTIETIINFFPPEHHTLVFKQLSFLLKGVLSLRLVPCRDTKGLIPAYEVMTLSPTISSLILEKKLYDIPKYITESEIYGMNSFNQCLLKLIKGQKISTAAALEYADNEEELNLWLKGYGKEKKQAD